MTNTFNLNGITYTRTGEETIFSQLDNSGDKWSCHGLNFGPVRGIVVKWIAFKDGQEFAAWIRSRATRRDVVNTFMMLHHIK